MNGCEWSKINCPFEVQTGFVLYKSGFLKKWSTCHLALRRLTGPPHELVRNSQTTVQTGKLYRLEQVRIVNYRIDCQSSRKSRHGFVIEFINRRPLVFICNSEAETEQWISNIQKLSTYSESSPVALANPEHVFSVCVDMLPSSQLRFSGACHLRITKHCILLLAELNKDSHKQQKCEGQIVSWPLHAIERCCFQKNHILLTTNRLCETGSGQFVFQVHKRNKPEEVCQKILAAMSRSQVLGTTAQIPDTPSVKRFLSVPDLVIQDFRVSPNDQTVGRQQLIPSNSVQNLRKPMPAATREKGAKVPPLPNANNKKLPNCPKTDHYNSIAATGSGNGRSVTFSDLVGLDNPAKRLVDLLSPSVYQPSTVLLYGPTGCGKKSLVHALAYDRRLRLQIVDGDDFTASLQKASIELSELSDKSTILLLSDVDRLTKGNKDKVVRLLNAVRGRSQCTVAATSDMVELVVERLAVVIATTSCPGNVDSYMTTSDQFAEHLYISVPNEQSRQRLVQNRLRLTVIGSRSSPQDSATEPGDARCTPWKEQIQHVVVNTVNQSASTVIRMCEEINAQYLAAAEADCLRDGSPIHGPPTSLDGPPTPFLRQKLIDQIIGCKRPKLIEEIEACAEHYIAYNGLTDTFLAELLNKNTTLSNVWYCFLQLCSDSVKLFDPDGVTCLVTWSLCCIRKYSYNLHEFTIETGSKAAVTGAGRFVFYVRYADARLLSDLVNDKLSRLYQTPNCHTEHS